MAIRGKQVIGEGVDPGAGTHQGWLRLMCSVLVNAYGDFWHSDDLELAIDGLYFLVGDAKIYCKALGLRTDPLEPVVLGRKFRGKGIRVV